MSTAGNKLPWPGVRAHVQVQPALWQGSIPAEGGEDSWEPFLLQLSLIELCHQAGVNTQSWLAGC